ncbi:HEAT repeat domain-containing protein [Leptospira kanakyensis]|uniref:HEAT repeat domain-containing protein n=1 Tax=Leptospira kanakyensis TaxID=2484968 RepID=A0A6N4QC10_9LEPT|nr:HEAT repeat domain-containing protein [Leptospira kanakyensis]TGK50395.1 HEAT repeat domain-containing protein [Leptospira kanakyensis]TGK64003.1 HEAT repeat domain-containing protein [Leptospira kanakyensis]TGK69981.1 HEAT repeat domain-containing protein [Leptospira kanakyensis]
MVLVLLIGCSTSKPYQLTDVSPKYKEYQGSDLDPNKSKNILVPVTNNRKYDDFIQEAHKAITLLEFGENVALRADSKKTVGEPANQEMQAAAYLEEDLPSIVTKLPGLLQTNQDLIESTPNDFDGPAIGRVSYELGNILDSLKQYSPKAIGIQNAIRNIRSDSNNYSQGKDIADADTKPVEDPIIAPEDETKKKPEKIIPKKETNGSKISIKRLNRKTKVTGKVKATEQINELVKKEEEEVLSDEEKKDREYTDQIRAGLVQVFQWEYYRKPKNLERILSTHPIPRVRSAAALALGRLKAGRVSLQNAIDKDGYQVRPAAYKALSDLGDKRSISYFIAGTKAEDPEVIAVSYEGLGKTRDPAGREMILTTGLSSEYVVIVSGALRGLAYHKLDADVEVFDKFLKSNDQEIKEAALEALAIHGSRESLRILEKFVSEEPNMALMTIDEISKNPSLSATFALIRLNESQTDEKLNKRIGESLLRRKAFGKYAIILIEDDYLRAEPNERSRPVSYIKNKEIGLILSETKKEFAVRIGEDILTDKYIQVKMESTLPGARDAFVTGWVFYPKLDIIEVKKLGTDGNTGKYSNLKKGKHNNLFNPIEEIKVPKKD